MEELSKLDICSVSNLISTREVSAVEVTQIHGKKLLKLFCIQKNMLTLQ